MFLDLENLNVEQLLQKQIEIRQRMSQARGMSGQVMMQLQNMLDYVNIELQTRIAQENIKNEKETRIAAGNTSDNDILNIG
jgi:plasmid maintenance system antidote protein VapI